MTVIVNHYSDNRRLVLYLVSLYLSKTADWQSKARVINNKILKSENVSETLLWVQTIVH